RGALLASLVALGVGFAAADTMLAKAVPDVFGTRALGAILGVLNLGWRCGAALGPAAAGFLYDLTGSCTVSVRAAPGAAPGRGGAVGGAGRAGGAEPAQPTIRQGEARWIAVLTKDPAEATRDSTSIRWPTACGRPWRHPPTR